MGYVVDELLKLGKDQIGYTESPKGSNRTKYGVFSDTPISKNGPYPWYNGKKNGECGWCAIGLNWEYMMVLKPLLGSYDKVRSYLGYPKPADNCAAGAPHMYGYHKKYQVAKDKGQPGDEIYFNTKLGKCAHVGRIVEITSDGRYKCIEYNKSDKVAYGYYAKNSSSIYAICHLDFSGIEPKPEPTPDPAPHPDPEPPKPVTEKYKVKTNTGAPLALRYAPNTKAVCCVWMPNKSEVTVTDFVKGQKIGGCDQWARTTYKGRSGYCLSKYLTKA